MTTYGGATMKKSKFLAGLIALGIIGGAGYVIIQNQSEQMVNESHLMEEETQGQENKNETVTQENENSEQVESGSVENDAVEHEKVDGNQAVTYNQEVTEHTEEAEKIEGNQELVEGAEIEENTAEQNKANEIREEINSATATFKESGMIDLYAELRIGQKKKWLKRIHENDYFGDTSLQYQISSIYEIGENQYYILGWSAPKSERLKPAEKWSDIQKETILPQGIFELVLREEEGNDFVTQAIYPSEQILSSEEVALYKKEEQAESNVAIKYNQVKKLEGVDEYVAYLDQAIEEVKEASGASDESATTNHESVINDAGQSEVTQYVQYAIENLSTTTTVAEENQIDIKAELLSQMKESMTVAKDQFDDLLAQNEISFNKSLNTVLKLQAEDTSFKKPIYIQLPEYTEDLEEVTGLRIVMDDHSYVYINGEDLEALAGLKIKIERLKDKKSYEITFLDDQDEVISQLEQTLTFAFKAKDEFTTVVRMLDEEEQNWGGQYESATSSISFGTKYSGTYKVMDNEVKIKDISHLTSSQQSAIKFMVSKGYLTLENERFNPEHTFSRYEFAEALVKMFFALDPSLETSFKDVPEDSVYYPYVASGETYEIIKGFADGTFKGDTHILKEQVISLCARTIADQKGYVYPEHTEDYLKFADVDEIGKWAVHDIALAVQSGLTTAGGSLSPKAEITKAESAEVLYQLFMLLYETTPGDVMEVTVEQKTYSILGTLLLLALALWVIWRFIKKFAVILTMIACTIAIIITLIIGFSGGF